MVVGTVYKTKENFGATENTDTYQTTTKDYHMQSPDHGDMTVSIKVGPENGKWNCSNYKKVPVVVIDNVSYCPTCGRPVKDWFNKGSYRRLHTGLWGNYNGC